MTQKGTNIHFKQDYIDRFWSKVDRTQIITDCWVWLDGKFTSGYGQFRYKKKKVRAHRFSYQLIKGSIPDGLVLDHICRNKTCVNPDHLEAVTDRENIMRGVGLAVINSKKTHCKRGHPLNGDNIYNTNDGKRHCKTCVRGRLYKYD